MRPCLVLNDFNGGGAERLVKDLAVELDGRDEVDPVVVVSNSRGELESEFEASGVELSVLDVEVSMTTVPSIPMWILWRGSHPASVSNTPSGKCSDPSFRGFPLSGLPVML